VDGNNTNMSPTLMSALTPDNCTFLVHRLAVVLLIIAVLSPPPPLLLLGS
jgi:hypothetical protein